MSDKLGEDLKEAIARWAFVHEKTGKKIVILDDVNLLIDSMIGDN